MSLPVHPAPGLQACSYAEFIAAYAQGGAPSPVQRFGALDSVAFLGQAQRMLGEDVRANEVDRLEQSLQLQAHAFDAMAPAIARATRKALKAGLVDIAPSGAGVTRNRKVSRLGKRQQRFKALEAGVRRHAERVGLTGASEAFSPQAPAPVFTTRQHVKNYATGDALLSSKVTANLSAGSVLGGHLAQGASELALLAPLVWHATTIEGVLLGKLSAIEQAKYKVLMNLPAAEAVLRSWMKGERPDPQLGEQAREFWTSAAAWPDTAAVIAATYRQARVGQGTLPSRSQRMTALDIERQQADGRQAGKGWFRDVPGSAATGTAGICRAAVYFLGDTALLGAAGPIAVMAGLLDMSQGTDEHVWAQVTKQQFRWRFEQLEKLEADAGKNPRHAAVLLTAMLYCARKADIANTEMTIALSRIVSGFLRAGSGTMSLAAMGPALGVGIAAGTAAAAGKAAVVVAGVAAIAFQGLMAYRQHLRAKEAHAQKEGERSGEAIKATRDFDALCEAFEEGFTVHRGKGRLVDADVGYGGTKEKHYGPGGNEMLAWEVMAGEIVDGFRAGDPLSFPMKMLLSLGLHVLDADLLEQGVLAKLHAGDDAGAVDLVEKAIRGLLAAPAARTAEAVHPQVFKDVFLHAVEAARDLVGDDPADAAIAAVLFNPKERHGLGVDRQAFERSMKVLAQDIDRLGSTAPADGIFLRMHAFAQALPSLPRHPETPAVRHLRAWAGIASRGMAAGWSQALNHSHLRIGQLLARASEQPAGTWTQQVRAALEARVADRRPNLSPAERADVARGVKQVLLSDVQALQAAGMLGGQAGLIAQELSEVLAP